MHALFFWFVTIVIPHITVHWEGDKMPKDCLFLEKQWNWTWYILFVPVALCPSHPPTGCSIEGGTRCCLHHLKKCNKCFQWITNFNIDPQPTCIFVTSLFGGFRCLCLLLWLLVGHMILSWSFFTGLFFAADCTSVSLIARCTSVNRSNLEHYWLHLDKYVFISV